MEWYLVILVIFGGLIFVMASGMPVALSILLIDMVGAYVFLGGSAGLEQLILSMYTSLATFVLVPVPLFVLMGEIMLHSGVARIMMEVLDKWIGTIPGRLGLLTVAAGTVLAALTGSSLASIAVLASVVIPLMEKQGYKKSMTLGPILGSGGLAMMIPPSAMAVLLGAVGEISVGDLLIAIIGPGLLMAALYAGYIIIRCRLQPSLAPAYDLGEFPLSTKIMETIKYVLPFGVVIFLVIGVMILGVATPSEAAATGTVGMFFIVVVYKRLNLDVVKKSIAGTLKITGMIYMIVAGASAFGEILSFSGATRGLAQFAIDLPVPPIVLIILMQIVLLFLGMFMSMIAIMMITLPVFMPLVLTLGFNPVWFGALFLLNMEVALLSPPFGLSLYVMKGVSPPGTTMVEVIGAGLPFIALDLVTMALILAFPPIALWLPRLMH